MRLFLDLLTSHFNIPFNQSTISASKAAIKSLRFSCAYMSFDVNNSNFFMLNILKLDMRLSIQSL